jgi:CheY-like chemotaxis protein
VTRRLRRAAPPPLESAPEPALEGTKLRILVIDDEASVREALADSLSEDGHVVIQAASGHDGLTRLADGVEVDVVLTDLGMPGMTGWDVARAVHARHPDLPVGLVTGWAVALEITQEDLRGVDFLIAKPYTTETLRAALAGIRPRT